MSFTARLGVDVTVVEAGSSVPLSIEIANRSEERDQFEMEVEGIDPEWTAVPVPTFFVEATEEQSEKVFFKPPRASESLAGNYPFVIKIRSLISGEARSVQGVLEVRPFNHLSAEINPKRGSVTPMRRQEDFDLTIMNLGNTEHTLQLIGNDPEDECAFAFEPEQVTVGPGQQKEVYVAVSLNAQKPFSGSHLYGFSVSARSIESPSVVCSAQAQLERKPLVSPLGLIGAALFLIVAIGWFLLMPKAPQLQILSIEPNPVTVGQEVTVKWQADALSKVRLVFGTHQEILPSTGEYKFTPDKVGKFTVEAVAVRDSRESEKKTASYDVIEAPAPPEPKILKFAISPTTVKKGETATVTYEFNENVTRARLEPINLDLSANGNSANFVATTTGNIKFTLVAEAAGNSKPAKKSITIHVVEGSLATIVKFDADRKEVTPTDGKITLSWQLTNAVRAEISQGSNPPTVVDQNMGSQEFNVTANTDFILTGYDSAGHTVTKKIRIKMAVPTPPPGDIGPIAPPTGGTAPR